METEEISKIQNNIQIEGIKALSKNETETKIILQRLADNAKTLSALEAAEIIKNAKLSKDESIKAANEKYDKVVANSIKLKDELGVISQEQYNKIIENARKEKDDTITETENRYKGITDKATAGLGDLKNSVNIKTGEINSNWDKFWADMGDGLKDLGTKLKTAWDTESVKFGKSWDGFWAGIGTGWNNYWLGLQLVFIDILNGIIDFINVVQNAWNGLKFDVPKVKLPDWIGGGTWGGNTIGVPKLGMINKISYPKSVTNIQKHATGGIFTQSTQLGNHMFGEAGAEAIVPLQNSDFIDMFASKIASMMGNNSGTQEVVISIDGVKLARAMIPAMRNENSRIGNTAIISMA